ncbi:MAG TPA: P-loop NTPase fold protein, partial [Ktedonobacteraceae bacterium]|nr:P-loop NTPase fold protein [Ktedonobacteraceae bacterium]
RGLRQLLKRKHWIVIDFNAWQHQRLGSPWWWLTNAVVRQGSQQLPQGRRSWLRAPWLRWSHRWWYLGFTWTRWLPFLCIAFILITYAAVMLIVFGPLSPAVAGSLSAELQSLAQGAQSIGAVIAALSAVITLGFGLTRTAVTQANAPRMDLTYDPMRKISRHFEALIRRIRGRSDTLIAIFIEDLDRCQELYVVELLEGISTLFQNASICFVVAADRRWLSASFAKVYGTFTPALEEPGRPAGYLFVEKAFHLPASVPPVSKEEYLQFVLQQRMREEHLENQSDQAFVALIRKILKEILPTEDISPRTIERFVDACLFRRKVGQRADWQKVVDEQLVLWTLIDVQWPLLTEYLGYHPELVEEVKQQEWERIKIALPEHLWLLLQMEAVQEVIQHLDKEAVSICARRYPLG